MFFTFENASKIDGIRQEIERLYQGNKIIESEYIYAIYSLLNASDKVANVAAVYEAYLKEFKKTALKDIDIIPPKVSFINGQSKIFQENASKLIKEISGDILYLDPPYNTRQYSKNYVIYHRCFAQSRKILKKEKLIY